MSKASITARCTSQHRYERTSSLRALPLNYSQLMTTTDRCIGLKRTLGR